MGVTFKGGTSGCREDFAAPTPSSGASQPVLDTSTSGAVPSTIKLQAQEYDNKVYNPTHATPDFMPTGGTIPGGTDIDDPGATEGGWGPGVRVSKATYSGPNT